ncbi:MAG: hypothetical protein D6685_17270 [Bacteroidetes bacterium]|nr:hypothetical protein AWN76_016260 [Rhodothermaceae bacterium RA]RMH51651.1 MAG: hypothetical protein D6685_17270 [Bacteroidota bacterium]
MLNRIAFIIALTGLLLPLPAAAQTPASQIPLVDEYLADAYAERSPSWWNALSRQLVLSLDKPVTQVDQQTLQNIIFFATNHADKVRLDGATQPLLWIYRTHPDDSYRLMALAALHAIGDENAMYRLYQHVERETSERVRKSTIAALNDYYQHQ